MHQYICKFFAVCPNAEFYYCFSLGFQEYESNNTIMIQSKLLVKVFLTLLFLMAIKNKQEKLFSELCTKGDLKLPVKIKNKNNILYF